MNKYFFSIILIQLSIELVCGQIPNGSFEFWEEIFNYEKPLDWSTNQDTLHTRFERDTISIDGQYSLKIIPGVTSSWLGCESQAGIHVNFNTTLASNSSLTFYAKSVSTDPGQNNDVYLIVNVFTFNSDTILNTYDWRTFTSIEEFTKVEIPLSDENIDAISIFISGGAGSNPGDGPCLNRSISWIDGMAIDSLTSDGFSSLLEVPYVSVYPNPSNGLVHIRNRDGSSMEYELYSIIGELISKGQIVGDELVIHEKGTYILRIFVGDKYRHDYRRKIIVVN